MDANNGWHLRRRTHTTRTLFIEYFTGTTVQNAVKIVQSDGVLLDASDEMSHDH